MTEISKTSSGFKKTSCVLIRNQPRSTSTKMASLWSSRSAISAMLTAAYSPMLRMAT